MVKSLIKRSRRQTVRDGYFPVKVIVTVLFAIYSLSLLACPIWAFLMSLKSQFEYITDMVSFPKEWMFSNYITAFTELSTGGNNMFVMIFNSLWYSIGNSLAAISVTVVTAYVIAKYDFLLGKVVYWLCVMTIIIPIVNNLPSQFMLARVLGTYDTPLTIITSLGGIGFNTLLLYSFFRGIDHSYAEAAYVDGASHAQIFFKIMFPLSLTPVSALMLQHFTVLWNDSEGPMIFLPSHPTLASGLYVYQAEALRTLNQPVLYAGLLMASLPVVVLWIVFNKNLMSLQFGGGIKG